MAQNKTMAIKHNMAKKWAMKEVMENDRAAACATRVISQSKSVLWSLNYKPYSTVAHKAQG